MKGAGVWCSLCFCMDYINFNVVNVVFGSLSLNVSSIVDNVVNGLKNF